MKILVVGALRYSNFGDILFAKMFYNELLKSYDKEDIFLYETLVNKVSDFCKRELSYSNEFSIKDMKNIDKLIYISGGYFSNSFEDRFTKILWHIRYALPGIYFSNHKKDIYVVGVGEGDFSWGISKKIVKKILNSAKYISVRNEGTKDRFLNIGVTNQINLTSDTALSLRTKTNKFDQRQFFDDRKNILLHILPDEKYNSEITKKIFPAIYKFIMDKKNYKVILTTDGIISRKYDYYLENARKYFGEKNAYIINYESINQFCEVLKSCEVIITPKLHVGIVASVFEKSVLAFSINYEKTKRFYETIQYGERCYNLCDIQEKDVLNMLYKFSDIPIQIQDSCVEAAVNNLDICKNL